MDWQALILSLELAAVTLLVLLPAGLWLGRWLAYTRVLGKSWIEALVVLPLVLPPTVLGYYLLIVLGRESGFGRMYESVTGGPLVFTWQAAVVAAFVHSAPLLIKSSRAALESVDSSYEWAARNLGAPEWRVFWRVTLPLARRPIAAAAALAFARAMGDFGVTIMIAGNIPGRTQTVATAIYDAVESGQGDLARTLVIAVSLTAVVILTLASRLNPKAV